MNEALAKKIAAEHEAGKHADKARLDCWACAGKLMGTDTRYESLYPERELIDCRLCGCQHWRDGRCFASDPVGWPIRAGGHAADARVRVDDDGGGDGGGSEGQADGAAR